MAVNTEIISKGIYGRAQVGGYISVKQYMFIRYFDKKHVLVRFSNDLDVVIDRISFTIVQMNVNGEVIGVAHLEHRERIRAGENFSPNNAIVVDEACTDVRVTVDKAVSGAYEYTVRSGVVVVHYNKEAIKSKDIKPPKLISTPKKNKNKITPKTTAVAIAAMVLVLLMNLIFAFGPIIKEELFPDDKGNKKDETIASDNDDAVIFMPTDSDNFDNAE